MTTTTSEAIPTARTPTNPDNQGNQVASAAEFMIHPSRNEAAKSGLSAIPWITKTATTHNSQLKWQKNEAVNQSAHCPLGLRLNQLNHQSNCRDSDKNQFLHALVTPSHRLNFQASSAYPSTKNARNFRCTDHWAKFLQRAS